MDYNTSVETTIVPYIIDSILNEVDKNSKEYSLEVDKYRIKRAKQSFDYFKNEKKSCLMEVVIDYTITRKGDLKPRKEQVSIYIPQIIKSTFFIDGVARTHESYFDKCSDLNIGPDYISFQGVTYRVSEGILNFYIRGLGSFNISLSEMSEFDKYPEKEFIDCLKLTDRLRKKIQVIYGFDPGEILNKEILLKMSTSYRMSMRDHVVTKQLLTVDRALMAHIEKCTYRLIRTISNQLYKNGNLYISSVQSAIYNFFKGRSESVNPIHYPDNLNELTYLVSSKKVIMETGAKKKLHVAKTKYNPTFFDVVDAAVTPDSQNINRKNELAQCIDVNADGSINIKVYDKKFNEVSIELLDYMLADILHYEEVDYLGSRVLSSSGPWKVKHRGETRESDHYDFIDLPPDERLATTSRMIPMMSSCDSIRVAMGAKMLNQTISTQNSEPPLIASGHENIKNESPLAYKWEIDSIGEVVKSDPYEGDIEVKDGNGVTHKIKLPTSIEAQKDITINFIPPEVGTKLKKGDLVYRSNNMAQDGQLSLGQNLYTAFMYWRGLEFEDSVVISQACAERMTHIGESIISIDIHEGESINYIAEPGVAVDSTKGDVLLKVEKELSWTRSQEGINNIIRNVEKYKKIIPHRVPNNLVHAIVVDVKFQTLKKDPNIHKELERVSRMNYRTNPNSKIRSFESRHGRLNIRKMEVPSDPDKGDRKTLSYRVFFKIAIASITKEGDKLTNRFGSKGVIGKVVPNNEMPRNKDGRVIDIILNPSSVIARKNLPQSGEAILSRVSTELWNRVDRMPKETESDYTNIKNLLNKYYFYHLTKLSLPEFKKLHESLRSKDLKYQVITGSFSKYTPQRIAEIQLELEIDDKEFLIDGLRNRVIKTPIMTGWTYILKLHHMSEFPNKITMGNSRDRDPLVLGLGSTRQDGQVIGEMESIALMTHGVVDYLKEVRGNTKSDWFLTNMIQSSQVIVDKDGKALLVEIPNSRKTRNNYK